MTTSPYLYLNRRLPPVGRSRTEFTEPVWVGDESVPELLGRPDPVPGPDPGSGSGSVSGRILALFRSRSVRLGPVEHIDGRLAWWMSRLDGFVGRAVPVELVLMACPYKMPYPLKTDRVEADLGEALLLRRLAWLADAIRAVYPPGARITVLVEGVLGRCRGVPADRVQRYRASLPRWLRAAGVNPEVVRLHDIGDIAASVPNFDARWIAEAERMRRRWEAGDPALRDAYREIIPAQRSMVPTLGVDEHELAATTTTGDLGRFLHDVAHHAFFCYRAFLELRDRAGYLDTVAPGALKLTVSPKPGNLAIHPIGADTDILPYHGVPVRRNGAWTIDYLYSLRTAGGRVTPVMSPDDSDPAPIGYLQRGPDGAPR